MRNNNKKLFIVFFLVASIILGLVIFYSASISEEESIIWNVPYLGIYNFDPGIFSAVAASYSVTQYWRLFDASLPNPSLPSLFKTFNIDLRAMEDYLHELGYRVEVVRITNPRKLMRFIKEEKTPLIFLQTQVPNQEESNKSLVVRLLVGVSLKRKMLIVHDPNFGPAYQLSFDEWRKSYPGWLPENFRFAFIVARPKNYKELLAKPAPSPVPYPDRAEYDKYKEIATLYAKSLYTASLGNPDWANPARLPLLEAVLNHPLFPAMPRFFKVTMYDKMAISFIAMGQYERAKEYAEKAISYNFDLGEPPGIWHWQGSPIKQTPLPWKLLGDAYVGLKEFKKAREAYEKAIEVYAAFPPEYHRDFSPRFTAAEDALRALKGR